MTSIDAKERTYGGWRRPASPGVGGLKLIPSLVAMVALGMTLLISMAAGFLAAIAFAAGVAVLTVPAVIPFRGRSVYSELTKSVRWWHHARTGRHLYRSGLAGVAPSGTRALPGLLAKTKVWAARDALGREFALIHMPTARQWAVVMQVAAQGGALVDSDTVDVWVASWGEWLALLGQEGGIVQVAAVVETVPDAGAMLESHVDGMIREGTPAFAQQVMRAAAAELPTEVADTLGFVTLTFSERGLGVDHKGEEATAAAVAEEVGRRLPGLSVSLRDTGASEGSPLTVEQLARRVREAFDPAVAVPNAQQEAAGEPVVTEWDDAGPSAHQESATTYVHDSGISRTWEATKMPPGIVRDSVLSRLMGPMDAAPRKRTTLLYRPLDAGETALTVDRDYKSAINRAGRRKGLVHAHDSADVRSARQATEEEADGSGVGTFSLLVTATTTNPDDFDRTCTSVDRAARGARFRLSPVVGAQAAAFAGALGIGLSLPDQSVLPHVMREHI